jgi:hypothetical protein
LCGVAIQCVGLLGYFGAVLFLSGDGYLKAFQADQLQAMAMLCLNLHTSGFMMANLFFGIWLFPLGYLVFKSRFLPRFLGIFLFLDCLAVLTWVFRFFLFPGGDAINYVLFPTMFIAEFSLGAWLLIMGIKSPPRGDMRAGG